MKGKTSKYAYTVRRIRALAVGQWIELPRYPNDQASMSRLRSGIGANRRGVYLRFTLRPLESARGIRIQRQKDWPGPLTEF